MVFIGESSGDLYTDKDYRSPVFEVNISYSRLSTLGCTKKFDFATQKRVTILCRIRSKRFIYTRSYTGKTIVLLECIDPSYFFLSLRLVHA